MTFKEMQGLAATRLGTPDPPWERVLDIRQLLNREYDQLVGEHRLSTSTASLTHTSGSASVTLPAGVNMVLGIETPGGPLTAIEPSRFASYVTRYTGSNAPAAPRNYIFLTPTSIKVWPTPASSASDWTLYYVPVTTDMSSDSDTPSLIPTAWHTLIVERTVYWMALADENLPLADRSLQKVQAQTQALEAWVQARQGGRPRSVRTNVDTTLPTPQQVSGVGL